MVLWNRSDKSYDCHKIDLSLDNHMICLMTNSQIVLWNPAPLVFWKKNKFKIGRKNLYNKFIRPLLEYASIAWDGCSKQHAEKLEK